MNNLIDREALKRDVRDVVFAVADTPLSNDAMSKLVFQMGELLAKKIDDAPAVDAEPVRHGRWVWADDGYLRCSLCKQKAPTTTQYQDEPIQTATDYCPNCGAKMTDGDVNAYSNLSE